MSQSQFGYLCDLQFATRRAYDVKLLIDMDVQDTHITTDNRRPPTGVVGPNAILTPFGWCLVGKAPRDTCRSIADPEIHFLRFDGLRNLEDSEKRFWRTQPFHVGDAPKSLWYRKMKPMKPN